MSNPPKEDGFGILKTNNQVMYKGNWKRGRFNGKGKLILPEYTYDGSFEDGKF